VYILEHAKYDTLSTEAPAVKPFIIKITATPIAIVIKKN